MSARALLPVPRLPWLRRLRGPGAAVLAVLLLLLASACGFGDYSPPPLPPSAITSFTPGNLVITQGDSTTLTPVFTTGTGFVDQGVGPVRSGTPVQVQPSASITYTLTVTARSGAISQEQATIQVLPPPNPSISADSETVAAGQEFAASVPFQNGCTYAWSVNQHGTLNGSATGTTVSVTAGTFGMLRLSCTVTNSAGVAKTGQASFPLGGATIDSLVANPPLVTPGKSTTLSYAFTGGDGLLLAPQSPALVGGPGGLAVTSPGSNTFSPTTTTTFTLHVTDTDGNVDTLSVDVTVAPASATSDGAGMAADFQR